LRTLFRAASRARSSKRWASRNAWPRGISPASEGKEQGRTGQLLQALKDMNENLRKTVAK